MPAVAQGLFVTTSVPIAPCVAARSGEFPSPRAAAPFRFSGVVARGIRSRHSLEPVHVATPFHRHRWLDVGSAGVSARTHPDEGPRLPRDGASCAVLHVALRDASPR